MHVIEERSAEAALNAAMSKWTGTQTAWEAATWAVLHDTSLGYPLHESGRVRAFTFPGARSTKMPDITIVYEVQGDAVVIHDALFKESAYGQSGRA